MLTIYGARANNLKNIDVSIPLGVFTVVTGVSGSGKSTLINNILYNSLAAKLNGARLRASEHDSIEGIEYTDKVINIDQSPIGRTPRSNPASLILSASCSARPMRPSCAAIRQAASALTSREDAARPARAMV